MRPVGQLTVTDVNRDPRTVDVIVPAGVDEVEIELVSVLDEGDSAALLGAAASYICEPFTR